MKKRKLKHKGNLYKPNTKLYVILSILFGLIVSISFILICMNLDNAHICTILSAIISVFGGVLASIIVAWLIDVSTCKRNNTQLRLKEKECFNCIELYLNELFQEFADQFNRETTEPAKWDVWFKKLALHNFYKGVDDFYERMLIVYVCLNQVISEIDELNSGELKDLGIQDGGVSELIMLSDTCRRIQNLIFNNKNENIDHIIFCMNDVLITYTAFMKFSKKEYVPNIDLLKNEND